jgi:hypothetical protein
MARTSEGTITVHYLQFRAIPSLIARVESVSAMAPKVRAGLALHAKRVRSPDSPRPVRRRNIIAQLRDNDLFSETFSIRSHTKNGW